MLQRDGTETCDCNISIHSAAANASLYNSILDLSLCYFLRNFTFEAKKHKIKEKKKIIQCEAREKK